MDTSFATSPDGTRLAFECCGKGSAIVLLHGGGGSRQEWHQVGWVKAMLDWPVIAPPDFHSPTLWIVGSEDRHAMLSLKEYEESIQGSRVIVNIVDGLDHNQVFDEIDRVFPTLLAFLQS